MTSLIINLPHLQNRRQRYGATLLSALCWAWFVMPLVIVGGWLLGFRVLAQEVVWLGGWQSLVRLAEIAATIVVTLVGLWTIWTFIEIGKDRRRSVIAPATLPANPATAFGVDASDAKLALSARLTTVEFTENGAVAAILPHPEAGRLPAYLAVKKTRLAV